MTDIEQKFKALKSLVEELGKDAKVYFDSSTNPNEQKEDGSVVTEIDKKTELALREYVTTNFPHDTIVGEEGDTVHGDSDFIWIIDPIDGTDNFVRKIPFFSITITRLGPGPEDSLAIVHNPISGQTFASLMENETYENEHLCNLTAKPIGGRYFITAGGASRYASWVKTARQNIIKALHNKFGNSGHYRGSLLEFAYVAAGRLDGYVTLLHSPWDTAAGLYLVKASGGAISYFDGRKWHRYDGPIKDLYGEKFDKHVITLVSHPDIHDEIRDFIGDPQQWAD